MDGERHPIELRKLVDEKQGEQNEYTQLAKRVRADQDKYDDRPSDRVEEGGPPMAIQQLATHTRFDAHFLNAVIMGWSIPHLVFPILTHDDIVYHGLVPFPLIFPSARLIYLISAEV